MKDSMEMRTRERPKQTNNNRTNPNVETEKKNYTVLVNPGPWGL